MRIQIDQEPYLDQDIGKTWNNFGLWHCRWVSCPGVGKPPFVTAYRRRFHLEKTAVIRAHVSADERYELFLDGKHAGRGPERGDRDHWFFETYEFALEPGDHVIAARVWSLGPSAPFAQMTVEPGFIFSPDLEEYHSLLGTGIAAWEALPLPGYSFSDTKIPHFSSVGDNLTLNGTVFPWGFERGEGEGWMPVEVRDQGANASRHTFEQAAHLMAPALLPPMLAEPRRIGKVRYVAAISDSDTRSTAVREADYLQSDLDCWQSWLEGKSKVDVAAGRRLRVLIDLENYFCLYPRLTVSGGVHGKVRLFWAESLYLDQEAREKGNRDQVEGKYFLGKGDTFCLDGAENRTYESLWWQAGRYLELVLETGETPVTLERIEFVETRYPLEMEARIVSGDERFNQFSPVAVRALQMCSHETYMDCPYYEQLMYVGDTRLEVLVSYQLTQDDRLPRKALRLFGFSRQPTGLTTSRYPSRQRQLIPPFSLWWVGMVYDHALWRGNPDLVRQLLPGVRGVLDAFTGFLNPQGLVAGPRGWNFMDWVPAWTWGVPPDGDLGANAILNWQYVWLLRQAAELEAWLGDPELSARNLRQARETAECVQAAFWDEQRGLFADDIAHQHFSEHAQCLAILSGELDAAVQNKTAKGLFTDPDLARTTIYFSHYLFETCQKLGRIDVLESRLRLWYDHAELGMKTTLEAPEPSRSDCHAWGAHPLYHYFASILGIRPAQMGYRAVRIRPQLGSLPFARGEVVHPKGMIGVDINRTERGLRGHISLPDGLDGVLEAGGQFIPLKEGRQSFDITFEADRTV